jgi:hypothetical protein
MAGGSVVTFGHDALGRRTIESAGTDARYYLYDRGCGRTLGWVRRAYKCCAARQSTNLWCAFKLPGLSGFSPTAWAPSLRWRMALVR